MKRKITNNDTAYLESFLDEWGGKYRAEHAQYTKCQILTSWSRFKHLADGTHLEQMTNGKERTLVQRFWDIYMGNRLQNRFGADAVSSDEEGPDLCLLYKGKKIWIECVCPELMNVNYLKPDDGSMQEGVFNFPHVELLERITGAIRSKKKKYLEYKKGAD